MTSATYAKKFAGGAVKNEDTTKQELAEELHKPIVRKFEKRKVYSPFIENIWGADLANTWLLSKVYKGIRFLLCLNDIFSKYAWFIPLKDKKVLLLLMLFKKSSMNLIAKQTKMWVDKSSKFYKRLIKSWLAQNAIKMYSTHNDGKSVAAERFIRTLKNEIYNAWLQYQKLCMLIN